MSLVLRSRVPQPTMYHFTHINLDPTYLVTIDKTGKQSVWQADAVHFIPVDGHKRYMVVKRNHGGLMQDQEIEPHPEETCILWEQSDQDLWFSDSFRNQGRHFVHVRCICIHCPPNVSSGPGWDPFSCQHERNIRPWWENLLARGFTQTTGQVKAIDFPLVYNTRVEKRLAYVGSIPRILR